MANIRCDTTYRRCPTGRLRDTLPAMMTSCNRQVSTLSLMTLMALSGCSWFGAKKAAPLSPQIVVTGSPAGSLLLIDGVQVGDASIVNDRPRILDVSAGTHEVEVQVGDAVVFREETYVGSGEIRTVRVLSGLNR